MTAGASEEAAAALRETTILVVEDEALLLEILVSELEDQAYRVLQASTGEAAIEMLGRDIEHIDLVVTDIRLPGKADGWAVAEAGRLLRADLPVIYVTGYFAQAAAEVPGGILIQKPYRPSAIIAAATRLGVVPTR